MGLASVVLVLAGPPAAAGDRVSYDVVATVDEGGATVIGEARIRFANASSRPVDRLLLLLYGRRYARPHPRLDDLVFDRVYPRGFSRGDLEVVSVRDERGEPFPPLLPVPAAHLDEEGIAPGTVVVQPLPRALGPGEAVLLRVRFRVAVPHRFGTFGRYRDQLTLTGGWVPTVAPRRPDGAWDLGMPPPVADWNVEVRLPPGWTSVLSGRTAPPGEAARFEGRTPWPALVAGRHLRFARREVPGGAYVYGYLRAPPTRGEWRDLDRTVAGVLGTLADVGVITPPSPPVLVEAPLRLRLTAAAEGMVLVTDRLYHTDPIPERWEDGYVARALIAERVLGSVRAVEPARDAADVADGLAWWLLPRYLTRRFPKRLTVRDILQPFGAIPEVDQMLETPRFSFYDEYLGNPYAWDPLRDDVLRWHRADMGARVRFGKLAVRVGGASMEGAVAAYVRGLAEPDPAPFLALLRRRTGVDAHAVWAAYGQRAPGIDLSAQLVRDRARDGGVVSTVTVRRDQRWGDPEVPELVQVRARLRPDAFRPGPEYFLSWDGRGDGAERAVRFRSRRPVTGVRVDPHEHVLEVDEAGQALKVNNRIPRLVKVSLRGGVYSLDLATGDFDAFAGLGFRRARDSRHSWYAQLFHDPSSLVGLGVGYNHYFGRPADGLFRRNRLGLRLDVAVLDPGYAPVGGAPLSVGGAVTYSYESRRAAIFPTRGFRLDAAVFAGYDVSRSQVGPGEWGDYVGASIEAVGLVPLGRDHVVALRGLAGVMTDTLEHRLFGLGGAYDLRGLPAGHDRGPGKVLAAAEWRHVYARDLDLPLPLARLRGVQGALFAEAGWVGSAPTFRDEWRWGIGYGVRFYVDFLGVLPGITGFDVAYSPDAPEGNFLPLPVQVYLVGGQSF